MEYDLAVLGGGPGGYVAAIRAAQLGWNVALVDENDKLGGTCLRVGCIPSKALLESSHLYDEASHKFREHGIGVSKLQLDLARMMQRKTQIVDALTGGIKMLLKRNKVDTYLGKGVLRSAKSIEVSAPAPREIQAKKIIIASGSVPAALPGIPLDGDRIGDSTTALSYAEVPRRLVVIGGGYIGLELGSVWQRLGSQVTVLEAMDRILPGLDGEMAQIAHRIFAKQGIQFQTSAWVQEVAIHGDECRVRCKEGEPLVADRVLVCAGRSPNTQRIGLDHIQVAVDRRGFILVDENFETNVPGVFAIGDCIGGAMLAHKASEEGIACVEKMITGYGHVNYDAIPAIVYTSPEIASVGRTEEQLRADGVEYRAGVCPFGANGRARTLGETEGRLKILADASSDRILGVHAIGVRAGDLIAEAAVAMNFHASSEDLARCCHAHPTLSEIVMEAALNVAGRSIHT